MNNNTQNISVCLVVAFFLVHDRKLELTSPSNDMARNANNRDRYIDIVRIYQKSSTFGSYCEL